MNYLMLRFLHMIGFILIGGGLVGVFVADWRSHQTRDIRLILEACRYVAVFYDLLVVPGAVLAGVSGLILTLNLGLGFFQTPWLTGMWMLFVFEFVEGNTVTRIHFRRMLRLSLVALRQGDITAELQKEMEKRIPRFTHYLDLPLFFLIIGLGGLRPSTWRFFVLGLLLSLVVTFALMLSFARAYRVRQR